MNNEAKKQDYAETYLGTFGGFLPLITMILLIVIMSIIGMRSAQNFICAGFAAVLVGFLVFKDKGRFQSALISGVRNPTFVTLVLIFIIAATFAQILQVGKLTNALVIVMDRFHVSVGVLPIVCFLIGCLMSTASGSSSAVVISLVPILLPVTVQMGADPALMVGAIVSGGVFGDNISPISDTTIASTQGVGADITKAVKERIKYSITAAIPCMILFLVLGLKMAPESASSISGTEGSLVGLAFLVLPVLLVIMILKGANFIAALCVNILVGSVLLIVLGFANFETFFGTTGIVTNGISSVSTNIFFMLFIFLVLAIAEESGALNVLSSFMGSFAKNVTIAEAICGLFMCAMTAVTASGVSSMGFCGPIISKILSPFKVSPERMSNFMDGFGCGVVNLIPYSPAVVATLAFCLSTEVVDAATFTAFSYIPYLFYPMALLIVYWVAILTGWGRTYAKDIDKAVGNA